MSSRNSNGFPPSGRVIQKRGGENKPFSSYKRDISKTVGDTTKLLLITNMKSYMRFRVIPRLMTLDDLELLQGRIRTRVRRQGGG